MNAVTQWFFMCDMPKRRGVYEIRVAHMQFLKPYYSYWNGRQFRFILETPYTAWKARDLDTSAIITEWRGLSERPE